MLKKYRALWPSLLQLIKNRTYLNSTLSESCIHFKVGTATMLRHLLILALSLHLGHGECPNMKDLPVMFDDQTFLCAKVFKGEGHEFAVSGCNACDSNQGYLVPHGEDDDSDEHRYFPVGSILVKPGCTMYYYSVIPKVQNYVNNPIFTWFHLGLWLDWGCCQIWNWNIF